jgi:hypothetical protein
MADIFGTTGADDLDGTAGNDNIVGGPSNDPSSDTAGDTLSGLEGDDQINGIAGDDILFGNEGNDQLRGGEGNDTLNLGPGGDGYSNGQGDGGDDTIIIGDSLPGGYAEAYGGQGNDTVLGSEGFDRAVGEEGDDLLWGAGGNDDLRGGVGDDIISGGDGDDGLSGGTGNDEIDGGAGDDYITFADPLADYTVTTEGDTIVISHADGTTRVTSGEQFQFGAVTYSAEEIVCFLAGTRIATPGGPVPIEALAIGDLVCTPDGPRPIRWIGRRSYAAAFARRNRAVWPLRIAAGAIAEGQPCRDLFVSAQHALFLDGAMVEAQFLENGASIRRIEPQADLAYLNIELDRHGVILAEALPVETFLDLGCRHLFHNAADYAARYPGELPDPRPAAPRLEEGPVLAALRRRLDLRAGLPGPEGAGQGLRGGVDRLDHDGLVGWVVDAARPAEPVMLEILVDGAPVARLLANRRRPDLAAQGDGRGLHGFGLDWPAPLAPGVRHLVALRRLADGAALPGSPLLLEARPQPAEAGACLAAAVAQLRGADSATLDAGIEAVLRSIDRALAGRAATRPRHQPLPPWRDPGGRVA